MSKRIKIIRATTVPMSLDAFCKGMLEELSQKYEVIALSSSGEELNVVEDREGGRTIVCKGLKACFYSKHHRLKMPDEGYTITTKQLLMKQIPW